ncbi:response regulator [Ureibacillus sp. GCM10028918]|uniref:response regulator n=1 Tax=Ureibacillus sp. GCM10028918 TaxID=3273429 RepID=UPI00361CFED2
MTRVVLVDDEEFALISLEKILEDFPEVNVLAKYNHYEELLLFLKKETIDVVFLDIELGTINGLDLAKDILSIQPSIQIVFVTAHSQYAVQAFELNSIDYLLKPISFKRLEKTISRVTEKKLQPNIHNGTVKSAPLVIQCLHEFQVFQNNQPIAFKTAKVKELLAYLFTHRNTYIHRDLLIENLWPEQEYKKAKTNLHTCISHLRKLFSEIGFQDCITFSNQSYSLTLEKYECDAATFYEVASNYSKVDDTNIKVIEKTIRSYKGHYCEINGYVWAAEKSAEFHILMSSLLKKTIQYMRMVDPAKAIAYSQLYLKLNPYSDEIVNSMMDLLVAMGSHSEAIKVFLDYRQLLNDELGIQPNKQLTEFYKSLSTTSKNVPV